MPSKKCLKAERCWFRVAMLVVFREFGKILPYMPRGDLRQLPPAVFLGPLEEALHRVQVRALRMLVADRAEEELLGGEDRRWRRRAE